MYKKHIFINHSIIAIAITTSNSTYSRLTNHHSGHHEPSVSFIKNVPAKRLVTNLILILPIEIAEKTTVNMYLFRHTIHFTC